jgi:O-antigen ligase
MTHAAYKGGSAAHHVAVRSLAWPAVISFVLLLGIVSGGSSEANSAAFTLFRLLCILLISAALLRLLNARLALAERLALLLAGLTVTLVVLHLLPLPYGVFAELPGRGYVTTVISLSTIPERWMPLSLSPDATWASLLALMPPLTIFLAALTTDSRARWMIAGTILVAVIANVFLGLAQRFQGPRSSLYLYEYVNFGLATGFFSNRNNFAMLLCVAIPLIWAVTHKVSRRRPDNKFIVLATGAVLMSIVFIGLAVSASRSGILLGMLALALSTVMIWSPASSRRSSRGRRSLFTILAAGLIIGQFGMIGILRIAETDPVNEYRTQIRQVTLRAASDYIPLGSGFGTFRPVYAMHETPATMLSAYVNHAHNDWLELWLEGGFPAAMLMAAFIILFLWQAARVWNPNGAYASHVLPRAASIGVLVLLLHSLVEYPLRMPALASVFAFLLTVTLSPPGTSKPNTGQRRRHTHEPSPEPATPAASSKPPVFDVAGFGKRCEMRPKLEAAR